MEKDASKIRLIDATGLRAQFDDIPPFIGMTGGCVQQFIDKAPTVDAVEVVRCRSCVHGMKVWGNKYRCALTGASWLHPEAYCAYGERRIDA